MKQKKNLTRKTVLELIEGEVNHEKGFFVDGQLTKVNILIE